MNQDPVMILQILDPILYSKHMCFKNYVFEKNLTFGSWIVDLKAKLVVLRDLALCKIP